MLGLALCHGWGFEAGSLAALRDALERRFPGASIAEHDLGFAGKPRLPLHAMRSEPQRQWVAVGHSYGFAYLLQQAADWHAAIAINGFTRFCRLPGKTEGIPMQTLDATLARLEADAHGTLRDFYVRCGASIDVPSRLEGALLIRHLQNMRTLDLVLPRIPILALSCNADQVVPPELSAACFGRSACTSLHYAGNHMTLTGRPDLCLDAMTDFIEACLDHRCDRFAW